MNTFVPYGSAFHANALVLDKKRRFKQWVECDQMLKGQFSHHPAVQMWAGRRGALIKYRNAIARACGRDVIDGEDDKMPEWIEDLAPIHRAKLKAKMPDHYGPCFDEHPENLARYPVVSESGQMLDWVQRHDKVWKLDSVQDKVFRTGWAAIQHRRTMCHT